MTQPTLIEALREMAAAHEDGEPDRCAESIQPVIDAYGAAESGALVVITNADDGMAFGPFTREQAADWARQELREVGPQYNLGTADSLTDEEVLDEMDCAPYGLFVLGVPAAMGEGAPS